MKHINLFLTICFFSFSLYLLSCTKEKAKGPILPINLHPAAVAPLAVTQGTLTMKIDGQFWQANKVTFKRHHFNNPGDIQITGQADSTSIFFELQDIIGNHSFIQAPGTYSFNTPQALLTIGDVNFFSSYNANGSITIASLDTTTHLMSGSFAYTAYHRPDSLYAPFVNPVILTNGVFTNLVYVNNYLISPPQYPVTYSPKATENANTIDVGLSGGDTNFSIGYGWAFPKPIIAGDTLSLTISYIMVDIAGHGGFSTETLLGHFTITEVDTTIRFIKGSLTIPGTPGYYHNLNGTSTFCIAY